MDSNYKHSDAYKFLGADYPKRERESLLGWLWAMAPAVPQALMWALIWAAILTLAGLV
jgi:hypothetical protein